MKAFNPACGLTSHSFLFVFSCYYDSPEWYLSTLLVSGGISASLFIPMVQPTLLALFDYYVGDLYSVIYKASEPELLKSYNFGKRLLALVVAWFLILFVVELAVRLVMLVLVFLLRSVGIIAKAEKAEKEDNTEKDNSTASD